MNDTPGWASPGSAPSDGKGTEVPRPSAPADDAPSGTWAAEQPPAGQWTPPGPTGAGPTAPAPRPGGHTPPQGPGWGGSWQGPGWGGPPPAAKPGVIPLRPLGVGEILDGAVSTMRAHWRTVLGITLTVSVIAQTAILFIRRYLLPDPPSVDANATGSEALRQLNESLRYNLLDSAPPLLVTMLATIFTTAVLTVVISRSVLGRPVTLSDAWAEARPRLLPLLGLTLLLAVMAAAIMTAGILPGFLIGDTAGVGLAFLGLLAAVTVFLWLTVRFILAAPALMLERQSIIASMRRSAKLVRGAWWRMFGILALTWVLTVIVALVVGIPFGIVAVGLDDGSLSSFLTEGTTEFGWPFLIVSAIGDVVVATLTYPLSAGVMALLYVDQRIRREALDLDLARAAGLPGFDDRG
ncbi:glycerophosphoryl diester phosphodiesterase membrane domain-containing protein [Streptomyces sp. NBC_01423]|uniref:glycerophosphoryl diester phosphodiesterase membrane domain-containing protein n=1 Tax=Streptomyces sp. NBC_01423 TaxID=2903860 RepID=UPI002E2A3A69|nr:glycerophosphoryl diester phosphodiesterase membrane domain-containing protein [Streptomyces sp. NBC_01423]